MYDTSWVEMVWLQPTGWSRIILCDFNGFFPLSSWRFFVFFLVGYLRLDMYLGEWSIIIHPDRSIDVNSKNTRIGFVVVRVKPHSIDLLILPIFRHCQWVFSAAVTTKVWLMIPILSLHCRCDNYYQCQVRNTYVCGVVQGFGFQQKWWYHGMEWGYQGTKMQAHHGVNRRRHHRSALVPYMGLWASGASNSDGDSRYHTDMGVSWKGGSPKPWASKLK